MKYLILILFLFFVLTGCKKSNDAIPTGKGTKGITKTNNPLPSAPIDTDAFIHQITFSAPFQLVVMSVADTKLTLVYYENVDVLIPNDGYTLSFALHLTEDFSHSSLANLDYTTIDEAGDVNLDWVDDNLNNVTNKTVSDTTVNSIMMKKINVNRQFTFTEDLADKKAAIAKEDSLYNINTEKIRFSSYVYFTKTYPATTMKAVINYFKK
jgi:hypothetical protein